MSMSDPYVDPYVVGKLDDIFAGRGIRRSLHLKNNPDAEAAVLRLAREQPNGLIFANLIDFDMLYGHRRDPAGYARALEAADAFLGTLRSMLGANDLLIITADHGNDPTFKGSDHTREFVPLLAFQPGRGGGSAGIRHGFYDVAQSLAQFFAIAHMPRGVSFL